MIITKHRMETTRIIIKNMQDEDKKGDYYKTQDRDNKTQDDLCPRLQSSTVQDDTLEIMKGNAFKTDKCNPSVSFQRFLSLTFHSPI